MAVERRDLVIQLRPFMVASVLEIKEYNSTMTTRAKNRLQTQRHLRRFERVKSVLNEWLISGRDSPNACPVKYDYGAFKKHCALYMDL